MTRAREVSTALRWTVLALICSSCGGSGSPGGSGEDLPQDGLAVTGIHHAHLNTVNVEAALAWYARVWPAGSVGELAGSPAFMADMPLLFNEVDRPPPGAWNPERRRSDPQSPLWHIGAFTNTTDVFATLAEQGRRVLPLFTGPGESETVLRSGLTPYQGIVTAAELAEVEAAEPRDGGFGYLLGPDGVLFELTGGPNTTDSFSHVHLFHEQPRCAANWYVEALGMTLPPRRVPNSEERVAHIRWEECANAEAGPAGWPSLEQVGTLRSPNARVVYEGGSISFYPNQCGEGRCGGDQPLVPSRGQVVDHIAFSVLTLEGWMEHLSALQVRVLEEPHGFGSGRSMIIEGPDGLAIELVAEGH